MVEKRVYVTLTTILLIVLIFFSALVKGYSSPAGIDVQTNAKIEYYRTFPLMKPTLEFKLPGKGPKSLSIGGILPNGSFVDLGLYFGKDTLRVPRKKLLWYFREWIGYERRNGLKPGDIVPSLILLGTVMEDNQSYSIASSVVLDPKKVLEGYSVKVTLHGELVPIGETPLRSETSTNNSLESAETEIPTAIPGWSNGIPNLHGCSVTDQDLSWGYYWKLGGVLGSGSSFVPLGNVYLHGDTSKINNIVLKEEFQSTEDVGIKFSGVLAYQTKSLGIHSQLVDTVLELRSNRIWLNYQRDIWRDTEIRSATLLGIGVRGKYVLARYWKFIGKGCPWDRNTSESAYFIAFVPEIKNGGMIGEYRVEYNTPEANNPVETPGVLSRTMYYVQRYYRGERSWMSGAKMMDNIKVLSDESESPLFSLGIPLLPLLGENIPSSLVQPLMSAAVGITSNKQDFSLVGVTVSPTSKDVEYRVTRYESPAIFWYSGKYYRISTMFLDIYLPEEDRNSWMS